MTTMTARPVATAGGNLPEPHVLRPRPPFSFGLALAFLKRFPPTQGERITLGNERKADWRLAIT